MSTRVKLLVITFTGVACVAVMLLHGMGLYRSSMILSASVIVLGLAAWRGLKSR